ncbi:MAG: DNA polymerase III subunit delta' [Gammaproteobacteria bacterium]|nr:DNA polymerase III subunit delta' [Gammaproteobacteria bacterium]
MSAVSEMNAPLPWQEPLWRELLARARDNRLPHALLFNGGQGVGKATLARQLVYSLLCQSPSAEGAPCGQCRGCNLLAAGNHPDLMWVEPEEPGKAIPVDRIRAVGGFLALKGQYSGRQIIVIDPAEAMNRFAANSLLKNLEEPTDDALLILITSRPSLLLPTIRSRCQQVMFPRPDAALAARWLQQQLGDDADTATLLALTDGSPLEAQRLHQEGGLALRRELMESWLHVVGGRGDPLKCASAWAELGLPKATRWLSSWTMDLVRLKSGAPEDAISNSDLLPQLQKLVTGLELKRLFAHLEQVTECARWASGQLNAQLAMEDLMISWSRKR